MGTYKFYSSKKNIKVKDYNRTNIDQIINNKISNLPILNNDTNNVIEFNDGFSTKTKNGKLVELAVKNLIEGNEIKNKEALANPEVLEQYKNLEDLKY